MAMQVETAPPTLGRLRQALADARGAGWPFEAAWPALTAGYPAAVLETREAWQRAYEGQRPTNGERAVGRLVAMLDGAPAAP